VVEVVSQDGDRASRDSIDLAERDPDGNYARTIVRALHESQVDVDRRLVFLADSATDAA
jgi:hypothetical protein